MQNIIRAILLTLLLLPAPQVSATPDFELDLKELKKPSAPPSVSKKSSTVAAKKKRATPAKQPTALTQKTPIVPKSQTVPPVASAAITATPVAASELTLVGDNPCQLAERMAVAVARSVPFEQLLFGLNLKPVASVQFNNLAVLITCNIASAEAYTYSRLLLGHQVELINIQEKETIAQVARRIVDALALSYQLGKGGQNGGNELVYLFPADQERQRPLRLILQSN